MYDREPRRGANGRFQPRLIICHPDRPRGGYGLCKPCYDKNRYLEQKEKLLEQSKARYERHRNTEILRRRNHRLLHKYGLTADDYENLVIEQDGLCAICQRECSTGRLLCVDHDHVSGIVRGLLCAACNRGIGLLGDNADLLESAAAYIRRTTP